VILVIFKFSKNRLFFRKVLFLKISKNENPSFFKEYTSSIIMKNYCKEWFTMKYFFLEVFLLFFIHDSIHNN
jgi:hypothetical protein